MRKTHFDVISQFLLYRNFIFYKKFKSKITSFTRPLIFCYPYDSLAFRSQIIFTSQNQAEDIKSSLIPQLIFQSIYQFLIHNSQVYYTDASKIGSSYVGLAFYSPSLKTQGLYKISSLASIFTGESLAIFSAINHILDTAVNQAIIFTDSKSVLETLSSPHILKDYNYTILAIKDKLKIAFYLNTNITLVWILAHSDILSNETVNLLAKNATRQGIPLSYDIPYTDLYAYSKDKPLSSTQNLLQQLATDSLYFKYYPSFSLHP